MAKGLGNTARMKEKGRILFTGGGNILIDNLIERTIQGCQMQKCAPMETPFHAALKSFNPHVIVVCLLNETKEMLRIYDILLEDSQYYKTSVIIIGHEDDCMAFKHNVPARNLDVFIRPLDRDALLDGIQRRIAAALREEKILQEKLEKEREREEILKKEEERKKEREMEAQQQKDSKSKTQSTFHDALIDKIQDISNTDGRKSILVADDDVRMLNVIKLYLQDLYDVTVVPSGKLALKFLSKKTADLVLLDYMMPEMDGPMVLEHIRTGTQNANVPVLFLTGVSDKDMVLRGLEFRPNGYLLKPVTREVLLERVTEILLGI